MKWGTWCRSRTRYFLTSLPAQGVRFAQAVRQHWGIEENFLPFGSLMSPLMRMPVEFAKTRARKPSLSCVTLP